MQMEINQTQAYYFSFSYILPIYQVHSKITMASDVVPYYTVTALVPTLK